MAEDRVPGAGMAEDWVPRWTGLVVTTLAAAAAQYQLTDAEQEALARLLAGAERRLADGRTGYFTTDVAAAIAALRARASDRSCAVAEAPGAGRTCSRVQQGQHPGLGTTSEPPPFRSAQRERLPSGPAAILVV